VLLVLAGSFGILFVFLTPPFQAPDEYDHFHRAFQVSEGHLLETRNGPDAGGFLPKSLLTLQNQVSFDMPHHPQVKQNVATLWAMRKLPLNPDDRRFMRFPWYGPTNYFPQAAGIAIARALGAGPLLMHYAGRLGNLLVWTLIMFSAVRLIPVMKWTLALLALMPMSLWLAATLSADAMVDSLCFLFVAVTLRFAVGDESPMNGRRAIALVALAAAIALAKTAYLPITLLTLTIPAKKFGGRSRYWLFFALVLGVGFAVNIAWTLSTYTDFVNPGRSPSAQAVYILHHPIHVLGEYVGQLFSLAFLSSIIGKLGWYDTRLARPLVACYAAVLVWSAWMAGVPAVRLSGRQKSIIALAAVAMWLAVFLIMDLAFTNVGATGVTSLQGRYLIPLTPLVFLLLCPKIALRCRERGAILAGFSVCFNIYIAIVLWMRFYVGR
jgi:uncharacterized membrane protein